MTSIFASHLPPTWLSPAVGDSFNHLRKRTSCMTLGCPNSDVLKVLNYSLKRRSFEGSGSWAICCGKVEDDGIGGDDDDNQEDSQQSKIGPVDNDMLRERLEKIVGADDSSFSGIDLATLIRNKYGRSYDVQLIKKEFMGRNLLALNVMWKYMEQRSFPLTEEEYILRLDDVANNLKCWGAVSHVRSTLEKLKERPRIGKAVSIFIDMDESGGRANEWIYK